MRTKHFRCERVTGHNYCCSLGLHVDLKEPYLALHLLWYYIHIGKNENSCFPNKAKMKEFYKFQDEKYKEVADKLKECGCTPSIC